MLSLWMIIDGNKISVHRDTEGYPIRKIEGAPSVLCLDVEEDIEKLLHYLLDEFNLESLQELSVSILSCGSATITAPVLWVLKQKVSCTEVSLPDSMTAAIQALSKNKTLEVPLFGLNFAHANYHFDHDDLKCRDFQLLAHTINGSQLLHLMAESKKENQ